MVTKYIKRLVHENVLKVWEDVQRDYWDFHIPNEASFVNVFYHHLRFRLSALESDKIRIFTEHKITVDGKNYKADMVIAKFSEDETVVKEENIIAIFEFKLKWNKSGYQKILNDYDKTVEYIKNTTLNDCHFYIVSMLYVDPDNKDYLQKKYECYRERITQMIATYSTDKDEMVFREII